LKALFGRTEIDAAALELLKSASPLTYVKAGLPPFLLLHGTADVLVPIAQSTAFQAALQAVGVPCELVTVRNGPHGMMLWNLIDPSYKDRILSFLDDTLKPAQRAAVPAVSAKS
ncbi:MAG: rhgT 2, partial [Phycisphaerales bacterium]|nr:rhgT 2 [Phycisphaerales bacterium]